jgi:post-segregation antitoxin (ccd killing protein)
MGQIAQEKIAQEERAERVPIGAFVDREQRDELERLARERDCSMSRIVRRALASELERISTDVGAAAPAARHSPRTERRAPDSPAVEAQALAGEAKR